MATTPQLISLLVSETGICIQVSMHKGFFSEKVSTFLGRNSRKCWVLPPTLSACETEAMPEQQVITVQVFQLTEPNCEIFHTDF